MVLRQVTFNFIDTGSYIFNDPDIRFTSRWSFLEIRSRIIANESATGKTFFVLGMVKNFLDNNPDANVVYFESESALTKDLVESRGIDTKRIAIMPVTTVQEFRTQSLRVLDSYLEIDESKKKTIVYGIRFFGYVIYNKRD